MNNQMNNQNEMTEEEKAKRKDYLLGEYQAEHAFITSQNVSLKALVRQLESELNEARTIIMEINNSQQNDVENHAIMDEEIK